MTRFSVPEMSCGHCKAAIEEAVLAADEGANLAFDMEAREVEIDADLGVEEILAAIKAGGYEAARIG